jgi:hypothetical protein
MKDVFIIACKPVFEPTTGMSVWVLMMAYLIINWSDMHFLLMIVIASVCATMLLIPSAVFLIGWMGWSIWSVYA